MTTKLPIENILALSRIMKKEDVQQCRDVVTLRNTMKQMNFVKAIVNALTEDEISEFTEKDLIKLMLGDIIIELTNPIGLNGQHQTQLNINISCHLAIKIFVKKIGFLIVNSNDYTALNNLFGNIGEENYLLLIKELMGELILLGANESQIKKLFDIIPANISQDEIATKGLGMSISFDASEIQIEEFIRVVAKNDQFIVNILKNVFDNGVSEDQLSRLIAVILKNPNGIKIIARELKENVSDKSRILLINSIPADYLDEVFKALNDILIQDGKQILEWLLKIEDKNLLKALLEKFSKLTDIKTADKDGKNILHYICENWENDNIKFFINLIIDRNEALLNQLDQFGNSPLYYASTDNKLNVMEGLFKKGGKCIRAGVEIKSSLHIKVALGHDLSSLSQDEILHINDQDEDKKTALHYAIIMNDNEAVRHLIQNGARIDIADLYGRTPLHYMIIYNSPALQNIIDLIGSMDDQQFNDLKAAFEMQDNQGLSSLMMAIYNGDMSHYQHVGTHEKLSDIDYDKTELDKKTIKAINYLAFRVGVSDVDQYLSNHLQGLTVKESLMLLAALAITLKGADLENDINKFAKKYVQENIFNQELNQFPKGRAFGIEVELPNIPKISLIPTEILLDWFEVNSEKDSSVEPSILMTNELGFQELTSNPITNNAQLERFLRVCQYLSEAGARVNGSAGFHVHVNINGGKNVGLITDAMNIDQSRKKEVEMQVVKQIMVNFAVVEPILRGFMRWGEAFENRTGNDQPLSGGGKPISKLVLDETSQKAVVNENFNNIENISDLKEYFGNDRYFALNVMNLNSGLLSDKSRFLSYQEHGTIEFRIHEALINPILMRAWINFINRLVDISVAQVQEKIDGKNTQAEIVPYEGIEHLVFMLIADREYQKTWNEEWGAPQSAYVNPSNPIAEREQAMQIKIQNSLLYNLFQIAKKNGNLEEYYSEYIAQKNPTTQELYTTFQDLRLMVRLVNQFPGFLDQKIDENRLNNFINECQVASKNKNVNLQDSHGHTLLMNAAQEGDYERVEDLLNPRDDWGQRADPTLLNKAGFSAVMTAADVATKSTKDAKKYEKVIRVILDKLEPKELMVELNNVLVFVEKGDSKIGELLLKIISDSKYADKLKSALSKITNQTAPEIKPHSQMKPSSAFAAIPEIDIGQEVCNRLGVLAKNHGVENPHAAGLLGVLQRGGIETS